MTKAEGLHLFWYCVEASGENALNPRRAPTPLRRQHLEKLTRSCLAMRDPTNQDDIGWESSCRRYRNGFRNAWLPFQRHFLMVNLEFFRCRRFGNLMRCTSKMNHILKKGKCFLLSSLYRFPGNIHSLALLH